MTYQESVYRWRDELQRHFQHLSRSQIWRLAIWSFGVIDTRSSSLSKIALFLSEPLGLSVKTLRHSLREWYLDAAHKCGPKRRELDVESCFAPLLVWILSHWHSSQLALAMDATSLDERFVVLCVSVVYRGTALPVAWSVLRAGEPQAWKPHWMRLLSQLQPAVSPSLCVLVLADRGLYAPWLYEHIVSLGWHPYLRINGGGTFRPANQRHGQSLVTLVRQLQGRGGVQWSVEGVAFQGSRRLKSTLAVYQQQGCCEAWLVLTDLPPEGCQGCWYGLRAWIEHGFKFTKREGWQWQRTRMEEPKRVERLWLALAVATLWVVVVGSQAEDGQMQEEKQEEKIRSSGRSSGQSKPTFQSILSIPRQISLFVRGMLRFSRAPWTKRAWKKVFECWKKVRLKPEAWPSPKREKPPSTLIV